MVLVGSAEACGILVVQEVQEGEAVCIVDPICCLVAWDELCASEASASCASPPSPDLNGDGRVDGADLAMILAGWGLSGATDLDGSGLTDGADLAIVLASWTG